VDLDDADAHGVLFSHGARFGGHALYIKDHKRKYVYNFVGLDEQMIESTVEIPIGPVLLAAAFEREGTSMPTSGTVSLYINDNKVAEGRLRTQPGNFSLVGEGLNIGRDPGEPVTDDYAGTRPYSFVGDTIRQAIIDVSGEPCLDLETEAAMMMARE
jgi:arylsulfatase